MLAAKFPGESVINITEMPIPSPESGDVLLKVAYCGVCGSERKVYRRGIDVVPGHEVSGIVVDSNGTAVPEGARIAVYLPVTCGKCRFCRSGHTNRCANRGGLLGWGAPWDGGYAEYMRVPAKNALSLNDAVGLDAGVLLLDTIGTAFHAIRQASISKSDRALVVGCGPLGLGVVAGLQAFGVGELFATDLYPARLEAAKDLGAVPVAADEAGDLEEINLIIEVTGRPENIRRSIKQVDSGGKVVLVGEWEDSWEFEAGGAVLLKDFHLIRSWYFPIFEFEENQQMILDGTIDIEKLISHRFALSDLPTAFELFFSGDSRKILVGPGG
jgi:2-desacetyl-2-hydroxyethyl bacteriochlorophyllide A dehydrogenase